MKPVFDENGLATEPGEIRCYYYDAAQNATFIADKASADGSRLRPIVAGCGRLWPGMPLRMGHVTGAWVKTAGTAACTITLSVKTLLSYVYVLINA